VSGFADWFGVKSVGREGLNEIAMEALARMIIEGRLAVAAFTLPFEEETIQNAFTSVKYGSYYGKTVLSTVEIDDKTWMAGFKDSPW